jgi:hypothetical protein
MGAVESQPAGGSLFADFDGNGITDGHDFLRQQRNIGAVAVATFADGDATGEGDINEFDRQVWEARFGENTLPSNSPSVLQVRRLKSADLAFVDFAGASNPTRANSTPPLRGPLVDFSTEDELALFPRSIGGRNERRELSAILKSGPELEDVEPVDQWFSRLGDGLSSDAVAD